VLLAEDDDALRSMVASALLRDGFEVAEVCDGSEALEWLSPAVTARLSPRPRTRWSRLTSASSIRE
jgi:CheY-like chemotaxis protein